DIQSGSPLNFGGNAGNLHAPGNSQTLNLNGKISIPKGNGRDAAWFTPAVCSATITSDCFAQPTTYGQFGNLGPNVISGPGYWNMSLSVFREFSIRERGKLQLRGESFSVVNTPSWNNPDTGISNSTFGYITGAGGNRTVQLGAKLIF